MKLSRITRFGIIAITASAGLALTACSSSSTSGPNGNSSSSNQASSTASVAAAVKAVTLLEQNPTAIPAKTALPKTPAAGKTFVYLKCQVPQCALVSDGIEKAVRAAGWKFQAIGFNDADPSTLAPAFQRALALHPVAVALTGTPYQLWSQYVAQFEAIHSIIIPMWVGPVPPSTGVPANIAGPTNDSASAAQIAQWVVADSGGKANVVVQSIGSYQAVIGWAKDMKAELQKVCSGCKVSIFDTSGQQANGGGAAPAIVSYLRKNPSVNYFLGYNGAFFSGLNTAATAAGLKVKIGGLYPLPQNISDVQHGSGGAFLALNTGYGGWLAVDAALRFSEGAPQLSGAESVLPSKLVTKASAAHGDGNFAQPVVYQQQFLKLWNLR